MRVPRLSFVALLAALVPVAALAHAHLERAAPAAGATVSDGPSELQLAFSEGVVASLSSVRVTTASGASVAAAKPAADPGNSKQLRVKLDKALAPGAYVVHWHVVASDTHPTSGTYKFTVK